MTELESPGAVDLKVVGDLYRFSWPVGVHAEVDRISEHRGELTAEVTVRSTRPPRPGLLHSARLNLMSTQARRTLAGALAQREKDLDWTGMVETVCFLVRERYREGDPSVDLRTYERTRGSRLFIDPFVEHGGPTVMAAHGGSAKTRSAWAIAVTAATGVPIIGKLHGEPGPVMFLDYETDEDTADEILSAVLAGAGITEKPPIYYRRMVASLYESAAMVRRDIIRTGTIFTIVDSLGPARGGDPNDADTTIRTFNATRSLGIPVLFTDHVTNMEASNGEAKKPFGSAYTWNLARSVWTMEKAQGEDENNITVAYINKKRNNGRMLSRVGYKITFDNGENDAVLGITFTRADLAAVPGLAERLPLRARMVPLLTRTGPMKIHEIAEELGVSIDLVKKTVTNNPKVFWKGPGPDGIHRVAVLTLEPTK